MKIKSLRDSAMTSSTPPVNGKKPESQRMKNILIVDDDPGIRMLFDGGLLLADHKKATAKDGVEGLELFKQGNFDVVISDFNMPKMRGNELLVEIKKINPKTKVIIITGSLDADMQRELKAAGVSAIVQKPFGKAELEKVVENI